MGKLIVLALIWMAFAFTAPGQTLIRTSPENGKIVLGGTVGVEIRVENVGGLHLAHLYLGYDSTVVRFAGAAIGSFMAGAFFHQSRAVRNGSASLLLDAALLGRGASVSGSGTICTVRFSGIKEGGSRLACDDLKLLDTSNAVLACAIIEGVIIVEAPMAAANRGAARQAAFLLAQNYPNPFNSVTTIPYRPAGKAPRGQANARFEVYDLLGREVAGFEIQGHGEGEHQIQFDASGLPTGEYFYRIRTEDTRGVAGTGSSGARRMLVLR